MSDLADLLKVIPENGHANKPARNSMLLTPVSPLGGGRSRCNSKSIVDAKKDSVDVVDVKQTPPAMELAADLVSSCMRLLA